MAYIRAVVVLSEDMLCASHLHLCECWLWTATMGGPGMGSFDLRWAAAKHLCMKSSYNMLHCLQARKQMRQAALEQETVQLNSAAVKIQVS